MKNYIILALSLLIFCSCGVGVFIPYANNNYGIQTQVVLDRANYRVVDNVEVVIEVNNTNLKRKDVERSAIGELMRRYRLTGSQAFINVNIEEIDRQHKGFFIIHHKQHVAARATIIEFLQEEGEPIASAPREPIASAPMYRVNEVTSDASDVLDKAEQTLERIKYSFIDYDNGFAGSREIEKVYREIYERTMYEPTSTALDDLCVTTQLVSSFLEGSKSSYELRKAYKKERDIDRRIEILVEYAKKNVN